MLPMDAEQPGKTETATFALGCFWGPDARFGVEPGVVRTRVGYAGGEKQQPTYHALGNHTETVQIDYNPEQVSYKALLQIFWDSHDPTVQRKTQYASIIFVHSDEQRELAEQTRQQQGQVRTEIRTVPQFWLAEDYHQKFHLRQQETVAQALLTQYTEEEFRDSTVAARLNGYVSGYGSLAQFQNERDGFGLDERSLNLVKARIKEQ